MTILGIAETTVAPLIRPLRPGDPPIAEVAIAFARTVWSVLGEPGDEDAGRIVSALGPTAAVQRLIEGTGAARLSAELDEHGHRFDERHWQEALDRWLPRLRFPDIQLALRQAVRFGAAIVAPGDEDWPAGLDELAAGAPHLLWLRGSREVLARSSRSVALVGSRAATGYGEHVAGELAAGLVNRGFAVVSGAAYGIDGVAHRVALAAEGDTVAVLAGGLDRYYPAGHEQLIARIVEQGAVVAEVPFGTAPTRWRFLARNRLIAGMTQATVVVEAGWRSGALSTAGHAATLGRPIGVVPGPVTSSASAGCHRYLRENPDSIVVTSADEVAELAGPELILAPDPRDGPGDPSDVVRVLDALARRGKGRTAEQVARGSGMPIDRVRARLGELELDGRVRGRQGAWVKV